jgi:O-antigen/teichoic acid export membrane protein
MRDSMISRLTRGTAVTLMRQVINIFGQIVLIPLYLKYWGNQLYGEWQLLSAAVAYVTLLDFGVQTFAVNRMNQCFAQGNIAEFRRILHTALYMSIVVSGTAALLLVGAITLMPVERWLHLEQTDGRTAVIALAALALQFTFSLPAGVVGGVYRAVGEYSRDVLFNNIQRASVLIATGILLANGGGIVSIALAQLTGLIAHIVFVQWDLPHRHKEVQIGLSKRDTRLALTFIGPSGLFFLMQMAAALTVQGTTLLLGAVAGATAVAAFVALRALANCIPQVAQALGSTLWPELTALEARQDYRRLGETYIVASKLLFGFAITAGIFLHFTSPDIVRWWTGGRIGFDASLMSALILLQICQSWYLTSSVLLGSSNNHKRLAFCQIASSVTGLSLGAVLGQRFGPSGVLWSMVGAELAITCWAVPLLALRVAHQSVVRYAAEVFGKGLVFGVALYAAAWSASQWIQTGLVERIAGIGTLTSLAALLTLLLFWLDSDQRRWIRGALRLKVATS